MSSPAAIAHPRRLHPSPGLARLLAVFLGLHGVAHLAGTSDSFTKAADGESVDYLAAAGTWMRRPPWPRVLAAVSVGSLVLVVIALWSSAVGVVIDVALVALAVRGGGFSRAGARR